MELDLRGFDRMRLNGDEDCGVGMVCADCQDGTGLLVAYYDSSGHGDDPNAVNVSTVPELLVVGRAHLDEHHR